MRIGLGAFQAKLAELIPVEAVPEDIGLIGTVNYKHWPFPMDDNYNPAIYSQRYPNELPDSIRKCREEVQPCTIAYLITLEGARSLVQHVESNGFPKAVDSFMNDFLIARDRHYITDSDIGHNDVLEIWKRHRLAQRKPSHVIVLVLQSNLKHSFCPFS